MSELRFDGFLLENFDEDANQQNMEQNKGNLHNVALKADKMVNHVPFFLKPHMPSIEANLRHYERIFPNTPRKVTLDHRPQKVSLCNDTFCKKQ
jgi:hypothetical protein